MLMVATARLLPNACSSSWLVRLAAVCSPLPEEPCAALGSPMPLMPSRRPGHCMLARICVWVRKHMLRQQCTATRFRAE